MTWSFPTCMVPHPSWCQCDSQGQACINSVAYGIIAQKYHNGHMSATVEALRHYQYQADRSIMEGRDSEAADADL